ncbi:uncharacterized protein LOC143628628 [Bidens hawaiensis]|uniref:uncharacterized protein LOC143628628 n=1 Tax=Bidens hawaiensis TaxID=980011 RepID=UPI00404B7DC2
MNACKQVFPNATRNLCRWHIRENIKKKWKGIYDSEAREDFALLWTVLCESPTFDDYEYNCLKLQEMLCNIGKEKVWDYIHHSWLDRDKEKFVSCWMADRLNFDETTTNRVESQHENLKRHLNGANNTLHALAAYALEVREAQKVAIGATFEHSRIKLKKDHNIQENGKPEKMTESGYTCRHQLRTSMGLSCACELEQHLNKGVPIPLKSIDSFWRKLDFDPVVALEEEQDFEAKMEELKQTILILVDPKDIAAVKRYKDLIPSWSYPYIARIIDVKPDGNCGFRAIAEGLGMGQKSWSKVRVAMKNEMDRNPDWWRARLNTEQPEFFERARNHLEFYETVKDAPRNRWFQLPAHGYMVAQAFNCVLILLEPHSSQNFFPMREGLEQFRNHPVLAIANVTDTH